MEKQKDKLKAYDTKVLFLSDGEDGSDNTKVDTLLTQIKTKYKD